MTVLDQPPPTELGTLAEQVHSSIDRGCDWLLARIGPDGDPGARHCHYYRVPWALAITGNRTAAAAVLSWVEREALDELGDLRPNTRAGFELFWSSYPLANLATGAWHLERYDIATRLARRLSAYQDPDTGGALAAHPDHRSDRRCDIFPTAQLGMTGLTTGHLELAHGAFQWFTDLYAAQPDLPNRLYSASDRGELIMGADDEQTTWQVITDFTQPRQAFYNPGIAAAFLGRYHLRTGNADALKLARDFLELTVSGTDAQFDFDDSVQVCKFAWGASILWEATGDETYRNHAARMGQWFIDAQNDDGSWDNSPFLMERAEDPESVRVEVTAEFVQHQVTVATALGTLR